MTTERHFYQGKGYTPAEARRIALALFERDRSKPLLIGPVSMEIGHNFGLNETEALLDSLVVEGLLRLVVPGEMREFNKAYILATSTPRLF